MNISNRWSIQGGKGDFVLMETREGVNTKTGLPTKSETRTYHPTLSQCAKKITHVMGVESMASETVEAVHNRLDTISEEVAVLITKSDDNNHDKMLQMLKDATTQLESEDVMNIGGVDNTVAIEARQLINELTLEGNQDDQHD